MKLWIQLALRSLFRHRIRTLIQLGGMGGAVFLCVFIANLQRGSYNAMLANGVRSGSGHVCIVHQDWLPDREVKALVPKKDLTPLMEKIPATAQIFFRIHAPVLTRSPRGSQPAMLLGLNLKEEAATHPFLKEEFFQPKKPTLEGKLDVAIGELLAQRLGLKIGQKLVILCQDANQETSSRLFRIRAFIQTGVRTLDERLILTSIRNAQEAIAAEEKFHEVAILMQNPEKHLELKKTLSQKLPMKSLLKVLSWEEAMPQLVSMIQLDRANGILLALFLLLIVGIGTVNALMIGVFERQKEIGVLRALGLSARQIRNLILFEGLVLGVVGSLAGLILAEALSLYTHIHGIDFTQAMGGKMEAGGALIDPIIYTGWDPNAALAIPLIMCLLGIAGAIWPARIASKIQPAEAMRN